MGGARPPLASEWVTPRWCPGGGCSCSRCGEGHLRRVVFCEGTWRQEGKKPFGKVGVGVPLPCPQAPRLDAALLSCVPSLGSCPLKAGPLLLASPKRWRFPGPDVLLGLEHVRMNLGCEAQLAPPEHSHRAARGPGLVTPHLGFRVSRWLFVDLQWRFVWCLALCWNVPRPLGKCRVRVT